jgi:methylmalonyl-CoA/ethylmalonyl-CoA epimerase
MSEAPHSIHHITLLVRDLDAAVDRFQKAFGFEAPIREDLASRGLRGARFSVGESLLVLVEPTCEDSIPGRHLREHGEGVFLVSLGVDNLEAAVATVKKCGARMTADGERRGMAGWRIQDLEPDDFFGVPFQFTEVSQGGQP